MALERLSGLWKAATSSERRRMTLDGRVFDYQLRRSQRRTLALSVGENGVRVNVPLRVSDHEVLAFLTQHRDWLLKRLDEQAHRQTASSLVLTDGVLVPVLGRPVRVRLIAGGRARVSWSVAQDGLEEVSLSGSGDMAKRLVAVLRSRALTYFTGRVEEYCRRLNVGAPDVRLTAARTRWGSCSTRSGIRLHWRLIHLSPELIDYVVAHEVAHLREMNHSPRFWSLVQLLCPDWQNLRARLRAEGRTLPTIGEPMTEQGDWQE